MEKISEIKNKQVENPIHFIFTKAKCKNMNLMQFTSLEKITISHRIQKNLLCMSNRTNLQQIPIGQFCVYILKKLPLMSD